jgi:hypothetical protein
MNTCDWCGEKSDFNTEIRIAPIDPTDKLIWGKVKVCNDCRKNMFVDDVYELVLGSLNEVKE